MTDSQVIVRLTRYSKKFKNIREAATALGISKSYLADILSGRRPIPDSILTALGLERVVGYKRIRPIA